MTEPTVLITGAAKRLGAATASAFVQRGCNVALHYNCSDKHAKQLADSLNRIRQDCCYPIQADLSDSNALSPLIDQCVEKFGRLDHLVNNAAIFYPTAIDQSSAQQLSHFLTLNYHVPERLARLAYPWIKKRRGSIINLIDIYAAAGLAEHSSYVASKAALAEATRQMAVQYAPEVRVNGVSPGAILWPDEPCQTSKTELDKNQLDILAKSALKRLGQPEHIAATLVFLSLEALYTTGNIIRVDGGRRDFI